MLRALRQESTIPIDRPLFRRRSQAECPGFARNFGRERQGVNIVKSSKKRPARQAESAPSKLTSRRSWRWLKVLLVLIAVAGSTFALFEFVLIARVPPELVGRWQVIDGPFRTMTMEFQRDGTMTGRAVIDGQERELEGTASMRGNKLTTTTTNPFTGKRDSATQTVLSLTDTEFVTVDEQGTRIVMRRIK